VTAKYYYGTRRRFRPSMALPVNGFHELQETDANRHWFTAIVTYKRPLTDEELDEFGLVVLSPSLARRILGRYEKLEIRDKKERSHD